MNNIFRTANSKERHFIANVLCFLCKIKFTRLAPGLKEVSGIVQEDRGLAWKVWFLWPVLLETCIQSNLFFSNTVAPPLSELHEKQVPCVGERGSVNRENVCRVCASLCSLDAKVVFYTNWLKRGAFG